MRHGHRYAGPSRGARCLSSTFGGGESAFEGSDSGGERRYADVSVGEEPGENRPGGTNVAGNRGCAAHSAK